MTLDVEGIDLQTLVSGLRGSIGPEVAGSVVGRTKVRDAIAERLSCSLLEAELLVDTLVARGFIRLVRDPEGREVWRLAAGR
jgi:hypothetical protein